MFKKWLKKRRFLNGLKEACKSIDLRDSVYFLLEKSDPIDVVAYQEDIIELLSRKFSSYFPIYVTPLTWFQEFKKREWNKLADWLVATLLASPYHNSDELMKLYELDSAEEYRGQIFEAIKESRLNTLVCLPVELWFYNHSEQTDSTRMALVESLFLSGSYSYLFEVYLSVKNFSAVRVEMMNKFLERLRSGKLPLLAAVIFYEKLQSVQEKTQYDFQVLEVVSGVIEDLILKMKPKELVGFMSRISEESKFFMIGVEQLYFMF